MCVVCMAEYARTEWMGGWEIDRDACSVFRVSCAEDAV